MKKIIEVLIAISPLVIAGCANVHTQTFIPAQPSLVWSVLSDPTSFPEWHPVVVKVEGEFKQGEQVQSHVKEQNGSISVIPTKVKKVEVNKELNQTGGFPAILTFDHQYILEPAEGGTNFIQQEKYRGIGVWFWDYSWIEPAYQKANEQLKEKVLTKAQLQ